MHKTDLLKHNNFGEIIQIYKNSSNKQEYKKSKDYSYS